MMLPLYYHDQKDQHKSFTAVFYWSQEGKGIGNYRKGKENAINAGGLWEKQEAGT